MMVSIIMPCHNGERFLSESIDSVIAQTYKDWELLVIDDNSTDKSIELIKAYSKKDTRIKLLINDNPVGKPFAPRNFGIKNASGRYIAFLDCDDKWYPTKLENQIHLFDDNDCVIAFSYYKKMDENGKEHDKIIYSPDSVIYKKYLNGNCIGNLTGMYDTSKVGKIYQQNIGHEDYLMWLEILKKGYKAVNTKTVEAIYREQKSSISGNKITAFKWTWNIYRKGLKLSMFSSIIHFISYAFKGVLKFAK